MNCPHCGKQVGVLLIILITCSLMVLFVYIIGNNNEAWDKAVEDVSEGRTQAAWGGPSTCSSLTHCAARQQCLWQTPHSSLLTLLTMDYNLLYIIIIASIQGKNTILIYSYTEVTEKCFWKYSVQLHSHKCVLMDHYRDSFSFSIPVCTYATYVELEHWSFRVIVF